MKKMFIVFCFVLLCGVSWATDISFQVVQHNNNVDDVCEQTYVIEDKILDYFFNLGNIITNEPPVSIDKNEIEKITNIASAYAVTGGAQYFIQLRLFYSDKAPSNIENISLSNIESVRWTITDIQKDKKIADTKGKVKKISGSSNELDNVKEYALSIAQAMEKELSKDLSKKSKR